MKIWITKYALTLGVQEADGEQVMSKYIEVPGNYGLFKLGRDVHLSKTEAIAAAEAMRTKKLASLKQQIEKLERLVFK